MEVENLSGTQFLWQNFVRFVRRAKVLHKKRKGLNKNIPRREGMKEKNKRERLLEQVLTEERERRRSIQTFAKLLHVGLSLLCRRRWFVYQRMYQRQREKMGRKRHERDGLWKFLVSGFCDATTISRERDWLPWKLASASCSFSHPFISSLPDSASSLSPYFLSLSLSLLCPRQAIIPVLIPLFLVLRGWRSSPPLVLFSLMISRATHSFLNLVLILVLPGLLSLLLSVSQKHLKE